MHGFELKWVKCNDIDPSFPHVIAEIWKLFIVLWPPVCNNCIFIAVSKHSMMDSKTLQHKTCSTVQIFRTVLIFFHVHHLIMLSTLFALWLHHTLSQMTQQSSWIEIWTSFAWNPTKKCWFVMYWFYVHFLWLQQWLQEYLSQTETSSFHETKGFSSLVYRGNLPVRWKVWFKELWWCSRVLKEAGFTWQEIERWGNWWLRVLWCFSYKVIFSNFIIIWIPPQPHTHTHTLKSMFFVTVLTELSLRFVWVNGRKWVGAPVWPCCNIIFRLDVLSYSQQGFRG